MTPEQRKILDRIEAGTHVLVQKEELHDVLWQLLDDMRGGRSVCGGAKDDLVLFYAEMFPDETESDRPTGWRAVIQAAQEEDK